MSYMDISIANNGDVNMLLSGFNPNDLSVVNV